MDQSLVHNFSWGNPYGPMVLKVLQNFPPTLVLVHGWLFPAPLQHATSGNGSCAAVFGCCTAEVALQHSLFCSAEVTSTESCAAANENLHCNIEKAALQESGAFLPLSCGFQAPTFRHPRLGPAELLVVAMHRSSKSQTAGRSQMGKIANRQSLAILDRGLKSQTFSQFCCIGMFKTNRQTRVSNRSVKSQGRQ